MHIHTHTHTEAVQKRKVSRNAAAMLRGLLTPNEMRADEARRSTWIGKSGTSPAGKPTATPAVNPQPTQTSRVQSAAIMRPTQAAKPRSQTTVSRPARAASVRPSGRKEKTTLRLTDVLDTVDAIIADLHERKRVRGVL